MPSTTPHLPAPRAPNGTAAKASPPASPSLSEAVRKAVTDGRHALVTTEESVWSAPDRLPPTRELQDARHQLERGLQGASSVEIGRHIDRLAQLTARREGTPTTWAVIAAEYARLLGHHPADIWASGVDAWLRTPDRGRWFPSISELETLMAPMTAQRRTQLTRCRAMLARSSVSSGAPAERESLEARIAAIADAKRMNGLNPDKPAGAQLRALYEPPKPQQDAAAPLYVWITPEGPRVLAADRPPGAMSTGGA